MQIEITLQDQFPEPKPENIRSASRRREEYSLARDILAQENNEAISRRLEKDKEKVKAQSSSEVKNAADTQ